MKTIKQCIHCQNYDGANRYRTYSCVSSDLLNLDIVYASHKLNIDTLLARMNEKLCGANAKYYIPKDGYENPIPNVPI